MKLMPRVCASPASKRRVRNGIASSAYQPLATMRVLANQRPSAARGVVTHLAKGMFGQKCQPDEQTATERTKRRRTNSWELPIITDVKSPRARLRKSAKRALE